MSKVDLGKVRERHKATLPDTCFCGKCKPLCRVCHSFDTCDAIQLADEVERLKAKEVRITSEEFDQMRAEVVRLRTAGGFLLSAIRSGEPVYAGHCESCDEALAALHTEGEEK